MANKIQIVLSAEAFKSEPNRLSNWTRHLNQSKSIRLRRASRRAATLVASVARCNHSTNSNNSATNNSRQQVMTELAPDLPQKSVQMLSETISQQQQQYHHHHHHHHHHRQQQPLNDLGRVSINHVGVDYDDTHKRTTEETATNTSGNQQHPMISSRKSKSASHNKGHQEKRYSRTKTATTRTRIEREWAPAVGRGTQDRIPLATIAVMVASIVCCANLFGHYNCDTIGKHNPFSGYRSASYGGYATTGLSSATQSPKVLGEGSGTQKTLARQSSHDKIVARNDRQVKLAASQTRNKHMEKLLSSMAKSIERQHLGSSGSSAIKSSSTGATLSVSKPSKFGGSSGLDERRETNSITGYEDFLRDIMASHESGIGKSQQTKTRTNSASSDGVNRKPPRLQPANSKADHELRQIMLMHEHAAPSSSKRKHVISNTYEQVAPDKTVVASSDSDASSLTKSRWPSTKLLAKLPKDLIRKANLVSIVPAQVFGNAASKYQQGIQTATGTIGAPNKDKPSHSTTSTTTGSPFTPRANAKNFLMGPILGLGQMLMTAQPKPTAASRNPFSRHVDSLSAPLAQSSNEQASYSLPANELKTSANFNEKLKKKTFERNERRRGASQSASIGSDSLIAQLNGLSSNSDLKSTTSNKMQTMMDGNKKSWIMDGATHLAQTYFNNSFRDLLTLSQLPILSGGPVSTAPSDLEPGGKKWLANKQVAERTRGNRTNAMEDLLRYVYILTNVGVRRKRDPLKALGSHSHSYSTPLGSALTQAVSTTTTTSNHLHQNKRPTMLSFLSNHKPITSLIKLPPPKTLAGSKLSSLLTQNGDHIKSRGVMWDMATDPTLAVTMFHLLERASVALPLGFLLMPVVHMIRHPLGGLNLGRILPARASHRSVDFEELAKRLDMMDKILSRSMRPTHREA